jgi:hypothetical protein
MAARPLYERALAIREELLGNEHPNTAAVQADLGLLLLDQNQPAKALTLAQAALSAHEKAFGQHHRLTKKSAHVTTKALDALGRGEAATTLRHRYGIEDIGKPN